MIMGYSVYEILFLFFVYGFLGWCVEVAYCGVETGKFVNRGFLNGPICPIYGVGAVTVILCLTPIIDNTIVLFFGSAALTSVLELVTGFALDKIFHARWWDYSDVPFNIGGYICLKFSICWGFVCIALMKGIHPVIFKLINAAPHVLGIITLVFFGIVFVADCIITVVTINKLSVRIKIMDDIAHKIRAVSDEIGEHVYEGASIVAKKGEEIYNSDEVHDIREKYTESVEEFKRKREEKRIKLEKEIEELKRKYASIEKEKHIFQRRIIKAFPNIRSHHHHEQLNKLKEKLKNKNGK